MEHTEENLEDIIIIIIIVMITIIIIDWIFFLVAFFLPLVYFSPFALRLALRGGRLPFFGFAGRPLPSAYLSWHAEAHSRARSRFLGSVGLVAAFFAPPCSFPGYERWRSSWGSFLCCSVLGALGAVLLRGRSHPHGLRIRRGAGARTGSALLAEAHFICFVAVVLIAFIYSQHLDIPNVVSLRQYTIRSTVCPLFGLFLQLHFPWFIAFIYLDVGFASVEDQMFLEEYPTLLEE